MRWENHQRSSASSALFSLPYTSSPIHDLYFHISRSFIRVLLSARIYHSRFSTSIFEDAHSIYQDYAPDHTRSLQAYTRRSLWIYLQHCPTLQRRSSGSGSLTNPQLLRLFRNGWPATCRGRVAETVRSTMLVHASTRWLCMAQYV